MSIVDSSRGFARRYFAWKLVFEETRWPGMTQTDTFSTEKYPVAQHVITYNVGCEHLLCLLCLDSHRQWLVRRSFHPLSSDILVVC